MDEEVKRHLRGIRILVTLALLIACISLAVTYVLFKEVSVPLERLRTQELANLEAKVNSLVSSQIDGRMDVELQSAILDLKQLSQNASGDLQAKAAKALSETQALLDALRKAKAAPPAPKAK